MCSRVARLNDSSVGHVNAGRRLKTAFQRHVWWLYKAVLGFSSRSYNIKAQGAPLVFWTFYVSMYIQRWKSVPKKEGLKLLN